MITHTGGYPLDAWGADGYGIGCDDAACVTATIERLRREGARVDQARARRRGLACRARARRRRGGARAALKVAVHALTDVSAARPRAGVDVLAHTPVERLDRCDDRGVARPRRDLDARRIRRQPDGRRQPAQLRAAGVTVLYGTDLGNLRDAGPSADEMALLAPGRPRRRRDHRRDDDHADRVLGAGPDRLDARPRR